MWWVAGQYIGGQARTITGPHEQSAFVKAFCQQLRRRVEYRNSLVACIIEANKCGINAGSIANDFKKHASPCYFFRQPDVERRGGSSSGNRLGLVQTASDIAKQSMLADGAGIFVGTGIMTKDYYVRCMQYVLRAGTICRATELVGVDAEENWKGLVEEMGNFRAYIKTSEKEPEFVPQKMALSGKRSGKRRDDAIMAALMTIAAAMANINNPQSHLRAYCNAQHLDWETA